MEREVTHGESNESSRLLQQLLEERRRRLEKRLADETFTRDRSPRKLLASFEQQLTPVTPKDFEIISPTRTCSTGLWEPQCLEADPEVCRRCGGDVAPTCSFCRHCGHRLEDLPVPLHRREDGHRSASSRSFHARLESSSQQYQLKRHVRRQEQEEELARQCTFQPVINNKSEVFAQRARGCYAEALPERLGPNDARRRTALRDQAKELLQADDLYECTFTPRINRSSDNGGVPLHLRTKAIQQWKQDRVRALQEANLKQGRSFKPKISARSQQLAQQRNGNCRARSHDGCYQRQSAEATQVKSDPRCACDSSQRTLLNPSQASPKATSQCQDFLVRQAKFEQERKFRKDVRQRHASAECPFKPKISDVSEQITACNVQLIGETPEERIERLAVTDVNRRQLRQQEVQQHLDRACTFKPALSPHTEAIASARRASSPSGVHERLYVEAKTRAKEPASPECSSNRSSFRPQLDPVSLKRFAHVKAHYRKPADIMESIRQQQDRRAEKVLRRFEEKALAETADCTFRPELCRSMKSSDAPVVVSGLGRFFELRTLAQRQEMEQRAYEAKVFRQGCAHGPPMGVTIPEPFALSESNSCSNSTVTPRGSWRTQLAHSG
ncbi:Hypothetical protein SCF082_LOCUS26288 [Durusdinium trenchii]